MRVHLNVAGHDLEKHIKGLRVRPFVLRKLLEHLIDSNHEAFKGKRSPLELKARIQAMVQAEYLETEEGIPEDERVGEGPAFLLLAMLQSTEQRRGDDHQGATWNKRLSSRRKTALQEMPPTVLPSAWTTSAPWRCAWTEITTPLPILRT